MCRCVDCKNDKPTTITALTKEPKEQNSFQPRVLTLGQAPGEHSTFCGNGSSEDEQSSQL